MSPALGAFQREIQCPNIDPRLAVTGIAIGTPQAQLRSRVLESLLEAYACALIEHVDTLTRDYLAPEEDVPAGTSPCEIVVNVTLRSRCPPVSATFLGVSICSSLAHLDVGHEK